MTDNNKIIDCLISGFWLEDRRYPSGYRNDIEKEFEKDDDIFIFLKIKA